MMRIIAWISVSAGVLAVLLWAAFTYASRQERWSCGSELARQEIEAGLEAEQKYYHQEAVSHFERAVEISPDCAIARLMVALNPPWGSEKRKELMKSLETVDLDGLTDREAFLIRYHLAGFQGHSEEQQAILAAYLERHPDDPYALYRRCETLWSEESTGEVEACYEHLLDLNPNWVVAQNRLGYLAMAYGDFAKAEDRFRTYRYVAPDQANPHDSLGELLGLVGRYEEAEAELEEALRVRPDFCASYEHLIFLKLDQGDAEAARRTLERAERQEPCGGMRDLACEIDGFSLYLDEDWQALVERWGLECHAGKGISPWLPYLGALMTGDLPLARSIEDTVRARLEKAGAKNVKSMAARELLLMAGLRHLSEGRPGEAVVRLRQAEEGLPYRDLSIGRFKLYDRLVLAEALRRDGKTEEAENLVDEVEAVNPHYAAVYRSGDLPLPPAPR